MKVRQERVARKQNNGEHHNGERYERQKTIFTPIKIKKSIAEEFMESAIANNMTYSAYLEMLMKSNVISDLVESSEYKGAMLNFIGAISKAAKQKPMSGFGFHVEDGAR